MASVICLSVNFTFYCILTFLFFNILEMRHRIEMALGLLLDYLNNSNSLLLYYRMSHISEMAFKTIQILSIVFSVLSDVIIYYISNESSYQIGTLVGGNCRRLGFKTVQITPIEFCFSYVMSHIWRIGRRIVGLWLLL